MSLFFRGPAKHTVVLEAYGWQSIPISLQTMFMLSGGARLSGLCLEPQEDLHAACKNMTLKGPDVLPLNSGGTSHPWGLLCSTVNFPRCIRICFCEQDHFKLLRSPFSQRGAKGLGEGPWGKKHQVELQMGQSHPYLSLRLSRAKGAASWNDDYWYGQRKKKQQQRRGPLKQAVTSSLDFISDFSNYSIKWDQPISSTALTAYTQKGLHPDCSGFTSGSNFLSSLTSSPAWQWD